MRKPLWTILALLSVAIGAPNAYADSSGLCTTACVTLRGAPDTAFPSTVVQATLGGYEFTSSFPSDWPATNQYFSETRSVYHDSDIILPASALAEFSRNVVVECTPAPPPVPDPTPEPSSGILALSGIGLVFALRKRIYHRTRSHIST